MSENEHGAQYAGGFPRPPIGKMAWAAATPRHRAVMARLAMSGYIAIDPSLSADVAAAFSASPFEGGSEN